LNDCRFSSIFFTIEGGAAEIKKIQAIADWNVKHFGLE
jgi:pyruvate ferredoxin oxidoreductase beta subunit